MRELIKKKATEDHVMTAAAVWEWARKEMITLHGKAMALTLLEKQTGRDLVYRTRQEATGGDIFRLLEMALFRFLSPLDTRPFLQFNISYTIKQELQRIIGFGQSKSDWTYWHILHWVKVQSGMKLDPGTVCCDFEMALLQGAKDQFPDAKRIGCLFHWEQAIRRKLVALRISEDKIKKVMTLGALDTLTVLPPAKFERGIEFVTQKVPPTQGDKTKWKDFSKYFRSTWLKRYDLSTWNVHNMLEENTEIGAKTNNPFESNNRVFTDRFQRSHPSLMTFIELGSKIMTTNQSRSRYCTAYPLCMRVRAPPSS
ncbi:hypothetical protein C6341_g23268, partial [Phytophthora cactorum]